MKRAMTVSFVVLFCITAPALAQSFAGAAQGARATVATHHAAHKIASLKDSGHSIIVSSEQR